MNKKGFSTIELLVSFIIVSFVAIAMFNSVIDLLDKMEHYQALSRMTVLNGNIVNSIQRDLNQKKLYGYSLCGCNCYDITYQDLTVRRLKVDNLANTVQYGGITEKLGENSYVYGDLQISKTTLTVPTGKNDTIFKIFIPVYNQMDNFFNNISVVYQYDSRNIGNLPPYVDNGVDPASLTCGVPVNKPLLAPGMTAIKWNNSTSTWDEVNKPYSDTSWYNYANKEWANARTADGSMWVWIPRYIYKIPASNWHTYNPGTIDIQFSIGVDDNWNNALIGNINLDETANASNGTWTNHPAFTFGNSEVTGIWVAKFEASGTTSDILFVPNGDINRYITIGDSFTAARSMETNTIYGWGNTGKSIDTHLMKNTEWGAVAYLFQSTYGKNADIWINNNTKYVTGCAGNSFDAAPYNGCQNAYNTANGMQASTTGNIYGIYDMSGGAVDYVSAYLENSNTNLALYGSNILNADSKYKDVYTADAADTDASNYDFTINKKGDAIYETSLHGVEEYSWYDDFSLMAYGIYPWFIRGGDPGNIRHSGLFNFSSDTGNELYYGSFRATLVVGEGL